MTAVEVAEAGAKARSFGQGKNLSKIFTNNNKQQTTTESWSLFYSFLRVWGSLAQKKLLKTFVYIQKCLVRCGAPEPGPWDTDGRINNRCTADASNALLQTRDQGIRSSYKSHLNGVKEGLGEAAVPKSTGQIKRRGAPWL